ncbi:MAG: hypothetical protein HUU21_36805 [Polyangiaceae bacterium]|nr:hypothetical protein [Polyangiaceae bacterium]
MPRAVSAASLAILAILAAACASSTIPPPEEAIKAYAEAAQKGDADAIYDMLSEKSRRALSREEVRKLVADERKELAEQAKALSSPDVAAKVKTRARVRYPDGEDATLELEDQAFRISAADALPAGARTPEQALEQLRRVLARRSYAGLMRVLTPATRSAVESDLRSLVEGLEHPEGLEVQITGDTATVAIPGGHEVKLRREGGVWRVDDFD